jgi:hypothetical protein
LIDASLASWTKRALKSLPGVYARMTSTRLASRRDAADLFTELLEAE